MATAKKDEPKVIVELKGVKAKLQTARVALQKKDLKKSGKNSFANFDYFELADFLPSVNEIFANLGLYSEFSIKPMIIATKEVINGEIITKEPLLKEMAILTIYDIQADDKVEFSMEVAPVMVGNNSKQNMYQAAGGRNTYYKRYLYMNALEIVEYDESDAVLGNNEVSYQQPQITPSTLVTSVKPQPVAQPVSLQYTPQPVVTEEVVKNVETVIEKTVDMDAPLSNESKMEIMNLVNEKGMNGAELIQNFCKENNLNGPQDLLEVHKTELLKMIGA